MNCIDRKAGGHFRKLTQTGRSPMGRFCTERFVVATVLFSCPFS